MEIGTSIAVLNRILFRDNLFRVLLSTYEFLTPFNIETRANLTNLHLTFMRYDRDKSRNKDEV